MVFFKRAGAHIEYKGIEGALNYMKENGIKIIDEYAETMIFQIIEKEIFGVNKETYGTSPMHLKFDKYDFD